MPQLEEAVRRRAGDLCEYCRLPQSAFRRTFHIEHVVARQHGGAATLDNLALACWSCNAKKGPNLSGIDPHTGEVAPLFHPRKDVWHDHFRVAILAGTNRVGIVGLTAVGRATVEVLGLNAEMRQMLRYELWLEGRYEAELQP